MGAQQGCRSLAAAGLGGEIWVLLLHLEDLGILCWRRRMPPQEAPPPPHCRHGFPTQHSSMVGTAALVAHADAPSPLVLSPQQPVCPRTQTHSQPLQRDCRIPLVGTPALRPGVAVAASCPAGIAARDPASTARGIRAAARPSCSTCTEPWSPTTTDLTPHDAVSPHCLWAHQRGAPHAHQGAQRHPQAPNSSAHAT